jgi:hypothetical protein
VLERAVGGEGVCPCCGTSVLQSVLSAGDRPEGALLALLRAEPRALPQRIRDPFAPSGPQAAVIQLEDGKAPLVCEKGHDGVNAASAESMVGEVELVERGVLLRAVAERTERKEDLGDETTREDVGEVGDLRWWGCIDGVVAWYD